MNDVPALGLAVVGAAGWGRNVVRAFFLTEGVNLRCVCDLDQGLLDEVSGRFSGVRTTSNFEEVLADPEVRAVAVAVDAPNHHRLAKAALRAGRHVFVEKPLALRAVDAAELCALAEEGGLTLMVGHLLLYHPAVARLKALLDAKELGDILYLHAQRLNFGIVRQTENVWWSLAPHDVAVAIHLFGAVPVSISATGATYLQRERGIEDVAFATLTFADGRVAHLHVSWIDPRKRRAITVVGTRRMATFDDTLPGEKLQIYDRPAAAPPGGHVAAAVVVGEVAAPSPPLSTILPGLEPLLIECAHFAACVSAGTVPDSDGRQGLAVVRVLEAGQRSMRSAGAVVAIGDDDEARSTGPRRGTL